MNYFKIIILLATLTAFPAFSQTKNTLSQEKITEKLDSLKEKLAGFDLAKWIDFSKRKN